MKSGLGSEGFLRQCENFALNFWNKKLINVFSSIKVFVVSLAIKDMN